jgi:tetratricopeptide (TPR) repeat protein
MIQIDPNLLLLLIAALFILMFGGRSILRREGLSAQFAVEAVGITGLLVGGTMLLGITLNPIVFLLLLYLITMRSRLLVDAGNLLAQRGKYTAAFRIYDAGLTWWPDMASRLTILSNRGAAELRSGQVERAIGTLESVLAKDVRGNLGLRCEAATRYNLGLAYEQSGQAAKASEQYNETADLMPSSPFARAALAALERRKKKQPND